MAPKRCAARLKSPLPDPTSINLLPLTLPKYDVRDSSAAIQAFKRHFEMQEKNKMLTEGDDKILYNLSQKYQ